MTIYNENEIKADTYYSLQQFKYGQWMYCSEYSCVKGSDIPAVLDKERKSKYADPSANGEWRIVDCN